MAKTYVRSKDVFINCPFDPAYTPIFRAIVFGVTYLGFRPRCALELDDGAENRLDKILRIIGECRYGIHDISATELDPTINLPRFNMPLELGLFLGCKRYGSASQQQKAVLILDRKQYRYRNFISDVSGQDIHSHGGDARHAMVELRNWLASKAGPLPGGAVVQRRHDQFLAALPGMCEAMDWDANALPFADFQFVIGRWLTSLE